ncbi:MAG: metal-binding protein [Xenococcaceae cyanobacterium]
MPSGHTHDRITLWTLPCFAGLTFLVTRNGNLTLIVASTFLFSGLMFGPDLDIYSVQFKRWGKLRWIWLPYQNVLRHRSNFSHGLIIGTTLRMLYLLSLLALVAILGVAIAQLIWGFSWNWQQFAQKVIKWVSTDYREEAIALLLGLELGAMSHSISDWTGSAYKRYQNNGWKGLMSKPKKKKRQKRKSSQKQK